MYHFSLAGSFLAAKLVINLPRYFTRGLSPAGGSMADVYSHFNENQINKKRHERTQ